MLLKDNAATLPAGAENQPPEAMRSDFLTRALKLGLLQH